MTYTLELEYEQVEAIVVKELKESITWCEEDDLRIALFKVLRHFSIQRDYEAFVREYNGCYAEGMDDE